MKSVDGLGKKVVSGYICLLFLVLAFSSYGLSVDAWPMLGHDPLHTGYSTSSAPNTNNTLFIQQVEGYTVGIVVDSGRVYVPTFGIYGVYSHLYCFNATTGDIIFNRNYTVNPFTMPVIYNNKVFMGSNTGTVYCLNALNGDILWSSLIYEGGMCSVPTVTNGRIYLGCDIKMICLDTEGQSVWNYSTDGIVLSAPAVTDEKVYFGSEDGNVYCLYATNGTLAWKYDTGDAYVISAPSVVDGKVYVSVNEYQEVWGGQSITTGSVYCLNAENGSYFWSFPIAFQYPSHTAVHSGKVYLSSVGYFYCLDALTGEAIWNSSVDSYVFGIIPNPALVSDKIFFISGLAIYCLDATTGSTLWTYPTGEASDYSSIAVSNGVLYANSGYALYAFGGSHNHPPLTPVPPEGLPEGESNIEYTYTTSTTDPDGDQVWYQWKFGGVSTDWIGPFESGTPVQKTSTWTTSGMYEVKVRAKDSSGAESSWSVPLSVIITSPSEPVGFIYGVITDSTGNVIAEATVKILISEETQEVASDSEGRYNILVPVGTYTVITSKDGYQTSTNTNVMVKEKTPTEVNVVLQLPESEPEHLGENSFIEFTLAQQKDKIGVRIDVIAGETPEITSYNQDLSIEIASVSEQVSFTVSAVEGTGATIVVVRIEEGVLSTLENIQLHFDGQTLSEVTNALEFFNLENNQESCWMQISTKTETYALIKIASFSTHTITISSIIETISGLFALSLYSLFSAIILIVFFTPMLMNIIRRRRIIRK